MSLKSVMHNLGKVFHDEGKIIKSSAKDAWNSTFSIKGIAVGTGAGVRGEILSGSSRAAAVGKSLKGSGVALGVELALTFATNVGSRQLAYYHKSTKK